MTEDLRYLKFRTEDNVGIITLNRPEKLNAVSWELVEELATLCAAQGRTAEAACWRGTPDDRSGAGERAGD